jgi:hypothetical protein
VQQIIVNVGEPNEEIECIDKMVRAPHYQKAMAYHQARASPHSIVKRISAADWLCRSRKRSDHRQCCMPNAEIEYVDKMVRTSRNEKVMAIHQA